MCCVRRAGVAGFHAAARVHLVEASPGLRRRQRATLGDHPVVWADRIEALPQGPLLLLANEFFDALPIRQFRRSGAGWRETVIGLEGDRLRLGLSAPAAFGIVDHRLADTAEDEIVEICPAAGPIMARIGGQIAQSGGLALIVDYGGWISRGDTFQALKDHRFADPLAEPGEADLTAHVDFAALAQAARPAASAYATQGALLTRLGILQRAEALAARMDAEALIAHRAATHRLTDAGEMGELFKGLAVYAPSAHLPPGFA